MKSRSPQFLEPGGSSGDTCGKVAPWSKEAATTGYHWPPLARMKDANTVPSGATATAGSQTLPAGPAEPGTRIGVLKVLPPSADRANAMPRQPIHTSYTYPSRASTACSTSAFWPGQDALTSLTGPTV